MIDRELQKQLKAPFPATDHKERSLLGKGRWFFIPWQRIKERLDECAPDWQVSYSDPLIAGESVVIRCRLTIGGVSREGVGNSDAYRERTSGGNYKYGSSIECATADAFKNAAELFGVGAYLDDQDFVVKYLRGQGDSRGTKFAYENEMKASGVTGTRMTPRTELARPTGGVRTARTPAAICLRQRFAPDPYDLEPAR
jgi:hypothetical protein